MKRTASFIFTVLLLTLFGSLKVFSQKHHADDITGTWLNEERTAKIQVYKEGKTYSGKIIWLKEPIDPETGKPKLDKLNPDPKLAIIPLLGLCIMKNIAFDGDDEWNGGTVYDTKNGKTYKCYLKFDTPQILKLRGYIGFSLIGRTSHWFKTY
jgi:uncharacterized protein (DUF2147 family)